MKEYTCGNCKEVVMEPLLTAVLVSCKRTKCVIPHEMDAKTRTVTFWRVPLECPRKKGVKKCEEIIPREFWVVKEF